MSAPACSARLSMPRARFLKIAATGFTSPSFRFRLVFDPDRMSSAPSVSIVAKWVSPNLSRAPSRTALTGPVPFSFVHPRRSHRIVRFGFKCSFLKSSSPLPSKPPRRRRRRCTRPPRSHEARVRNDHDLFRSSLALISRYVRAFDVGNVCGVSTVSFAVGLALPVRPSVDDLVLCEIEPSDRRPRCNRAPEFLARLIAIWFASVRDPISAPPTDRIKHLPQKASFAYVAPMPRPRSFVTTASAIPSPPATFAAIRLSNGYRRGHLFARTLSRGIALQFVEILNGGRRHPPPPPPPPPTAVIPSYRSTQAVPERKKNKSHFLGLFSRHFQGNWTSLRFLRRGPTAAQTFSSCTCSRSLSFFRDIFNRLSGRLHRSGQAPGRCCPSRVPPTGRYANRCFNSLVATFIIGQLFCGENHISRSPVGLGGSLTVLCGLPLCAGALAIVSRNPTKKSDCQFVIKRMSTSTEMTRALQHPLSMFGATFVLCREETLERAREDERGGSHLQLRRAKFVREEMEHIREGEHGASSAKHRIASVFRTPCSSLVAPRF